MNEETPKTTKMPKAQRRELKVMRDKVRDNIKKDLSELLTDMQAASDAGIGTRVNVLLPDYLIGYTETLVNIMMAIENGNELDIAEMEEMSTSRVFRGVGSSDTAIPF